MRSWEGSSGGPGGDAWERARDAHVVRAGTTAGDTAMEGTATVGVCGSERGATAGGALRTQCCAAAAMNAAEAVEATAE